MNPPGNIGKIPLELLAPAKDIDTAITAINHGADAVYIGAEHHGARAAVPNSIEDIRTLCSYAHMFRIKVYVTLNTIIYDSELEAVRKLIHGLYAAGVDALIVQDMSILEMDIPPIALHASTQCDIRTPQKARFLEQVGFDQLVLPRELTLEEISRMHASTRATLECFVHGALCVSYSGDCRASFVNGGRSANRGECAQICRLPYDLVDGDGNKVIHNRHLLSLKDMNRIEYLGDMIEAGVRSFKIEGRLKSRDYVANVVSAYSQALDRFIAANPSYTRSSCGTCRYNFLPDPQRSFNRGFTQYFLTTDNPAAGSMGSHLTPKYTGVAAGKVLATDFKNRSIRVSGDTSWVNGDGISFFNKEGRFYGMRVNKVENNTLFFIGDATAMPPVGTPIYRNFDKKFTENIKPDIAKRTIDVSVTLSKSSNGFTLTARDERGCMAGVTCNAELIPAQKDQTQYRNNILRRTGNTIYNVIDVTDEAGNFFIAASTLTDARRTVLEWLDKDAMACYPRIYRNRLHDTDTTYVKSKLDMHDNVSNKMAATFYRRHGVNDIEPSLETAGTGKANGKVQVMTTRYCLRRELGACLKTSAGKKLKDPLTLVPCDGRTRPMTLTFDCANCRMHVFANPAKKQ